jgi:hypothetical protein
VATALGGIRSAGFHLVKDVPISLEEALKRSAACATLFPGQPDTCRPPMDQGKYMGVAEAVGGLDHVISLPISYNPMELVGGEDEPSPCLGDCDAPVGISRSDGGPAVGMGSQPPPDNGCSSGASRGSSSGNSSGGSSSSGSSSDAGAADGGCGANSGSGDNNGPGAPDRP